MLSEKGKTILAELYSAHRADFLESHPGYSENDCERDFLYTVLLKVSSHNEVRYSKISNLIETIR